MFNSVLILCSGNICRSPVAEGLLRRELGEGVAVSSAGITALVGYPADPTAVQLCQGLGVDISGHRARQASVELLNQADLILTMAQDHSDWVRRYHPHLRGRTHKWLRWRDDGDVVDPFRRPLAVFERALADIQEGLGDWVTRLR